MDHKTRLTDDIADYWAEIQESLTDALVEYKQSNPELIELMEKHPYFNTMIRNVFANGWCGGIWRRTRRWIKSDSTCCTVLCGRICSGICARHVQGMLVVPIFGRRYAELLETPLMLIVVYLSAVG